MSAYLKELTKPSDPFYLRLIKGSNATMPEFSNRGVFYTGTSGFNGTVVSNATNPLFDVKDYIYTSGTTSNLDFWGYNYTIPTGMLGKDASFKFNFKTSTSNFVVAAYALCTSGNKLIYTSQPITIGTSLYEAVFNIPTDCTGLKVGWQFIGTASGETFEYDNVIFSQWTPQAVNLSIQEAISYTGYTSKVDGEDLIKFKTRDSIRSSFGNIINVDDTTYANHTRFNVLKPCNVTVTAAGYYASGAALIQVQHHNSKNTVIRRYQTQSSGSTVGSTNTQTIKADAGDYFVAVSSVALVDSYYANFSITASAISENVVQSWQDGMATWSATSTIQIGATTTAPTKGTNDLDQVRFYRNGANGEFWYQYNQTGEGSAGSGDYLFSLPSGLQFANEVIKYTTVEGASSTWLAKNGIAAGTAYWGSINAVFFVAPYDSTRFRIAYILTNAGSSDTGFLSSGNGVFTSATSSFSIKFSAPVLGWSSTPTLIALPAATQTEYYIEAGGNAGQAITAEVTDIPFIATTQTNLTWDGSGFTAPINGNYEIFGSVYYTTTPSNLIRLFVNNSHIKNLSTLTANGVTSTYYFSGKVYLTSGQRVSFRASSNGTVINDAKYHNLTITRLNGKNDGVFIGNVQPEWQYDLTVTGNNGWSMVRAVGVVYKMASGQYRMRFNIMGNQTSTTSNTLSVSGVTFKSIPGGYQAVTHANGAASYTSARCESNSSSISIYSSISAASATVSGDVELESKPTWATMTN